FVARAAQELAVARVIIQEALHPGHAKTTQHIVVQPAAIGAVMRAVVDLDISLVDVVRQLVIEGRGMAAYRCNEVGLAGKDQRRRLYAAEAGSIPGRERDGCLDAPFAGDAQGATAA